VTLLLSGLGIVIVLQQNPTGLAGGAARMWQRFLDRLAVEVERETVLAGPVPALEAEALALSFGGVKALQGATIHVDSGEIIGLIGANGAGKSTLINVVSGVLPADAGAVRLAGRNITQLPPEVRAALGIGRTFQAAQLFPGLTVRETVESVIGAQQKVGMLSAMIRAPWAVRAQRDIAREAQAVLERMGLLPYAGTLAAELSTGTRRICALATQVAARPKVLLLDEPTAGVAQREAEAFGPLLRRIRDELDCAIVIVEHDMPLLMGLCDRVYAMEQGAVIAEGTPEEIRDDPRVVASYLGTDEVAIARSGSGNEPGDRPAPPRRRTPAVVAAATRSRTRTTAATRKARA
jgi:ABC-type branched-subunit amino acid transport system ATPase component